MATRIEELRAKAEQAQAEYEACTDHIRMGNILHNAASSAWYRYERAVVDAYEAGKLVEVDA